MDPMPYVTGGVKDIMSVDTSKLKGALGGIVSVQQHQIKVIDAKLSEDDPEFAARVAKYASDLRDMAAGSTYVAIPAGRISQILSDGRLKTVFEKVTSTGGGDGEGGNTSGYLTGRRRYENNIMGVGNGKPVKPADRPVYGYIGPAAGQSGRDRKGEPGTQVTSYGNIHAELKPRVAGRTTVTFDDSLNGSLIPRRIPDLERVSDRDMLQSTRPADVYWDALGREELGGLPTVQYVEAQIHGGVKLDDIARFVVERSDMQSRVDAKRSDLEAAQRRYNETGKDAYKMQREERLLSQYAKELAEIDAAAEAIKKAGIDVEVV